MSKNLICSSSCSLRRSLLFFLLTLSFYPFYSSTFSYRLLELKLSFFELVNMMRCSRLVCVLSREKRKEYIHSFVIRHCDNNKINNAYAFATNIFYNISHWPLACKISSHIYFNILIVLKPSSQMPTRRLMHFINVEKIRIARQFFNPQNVMN